MSKAQVKALIENKETIESQREIILRYFKSVPHSNEFFTKSHTGISKPSVKSRISELYNDGLLYVHHTYNDDKNSAYAYERNPNIQKTNKAIRSNEAYQRWLKKAKKEGYLDKYNEEVKLMNVEFKEVKG